MGRPTDEEIREVADEFLTILNFTPESERRMRGYVAAEGAFGMLQWVLGRETEERNRELRDINRRLIATLKGE